MLFARDSLNRDTFSAMILKNCQFESILEIGPLNRPLVSTAQTKYFDLLPTDELKKKAILEGLNPNTVPTISYSDKQGNLGVIHDRFDNLVSAHVIEHQPDLIAHLISCSNLLSNGKGRYWLVIPDKRYCFDAFLPESSLLEIFRAYKEKVTKPTIWKVIEHRALTTHNDPVLHWKSQAGIRNFEIKERFRAAEAEYRNANGKYIDVHCWQFTPESFSNIIDALCKLDLIQFQIEEIWATSENDLEFFVILRKT